MTVIDLNSEALATMSELGEHAESPAERDPSFDAFEEELVAAEFGNKARALEAAGYDRDFIIRGLEKTLRKMRDAERDGA